MEKSNRRQTYIGNILFSWTEENFVLSHCRLASLCRLWKLRATEHMHCGDFPKDANDSSSLHTPYHFKKTKKKRTFLVWHLSSNYVPPDLSDQLDNYQAALTSRDKPSPARKATTETVNFSWWCCCQGEAGWEYDHRGQFISLGPCCLTLPTQLPKRSSIGFDG